jgi:glycosyltransferase involved in cell wall biosynthesis
MKPALVSVVIPARNVAAVIDEQLDALSRQRYAGAWEVVVVDNASSDDTGARARAWGHLLPALQVVTPTVRGGSTASLARNTGVAASRGDLVLHCDADDIVAGGWIDALVAAADDADMVGGTVDLDRLNTPRTVARRGWRPATDHLPVALGFLPEVAGGNCAIWRRVLDDVGGWNERYLAFDDVELAWRVQLAGHRLAFAPGALVYHRLRPSLGALWRRTLRDGEGEVQLYADFRAHGMPRTDTGSALRTWVGRLVHLPDLVVPGHGAAYVRQTGAIVGRTRGSVRHRILYL